MLGLGLGLNNITSNNGVFYGGLYFNTTAVYFNSTTQYFNVQNT